MRTGHYENRQYVITTHLLSLLTLRQDARMGDSFTIKARFGNTLQCGVDGVARAVNRGSLP